MKKTMVEKFLECPWYRVESDGRIMTNYNSRRDPNEPWREVQVWDVNGFPKIRYRQKQISALKVIYAALNSDHIAGYTVEPKDGNRFNLSPSNLAQRPPKRIFGDPKVDLNKNATPTFKGFISALVNFTKPASE